MRGSEARPGGAGAFGGRKMAAEESPYDVASFPLSAHGGDGGEQHPLGALAARIAALGMEVQEADALVQAATREDSKNLEEIAKLTMEVERLTAQMTVEATAHASHIATLEDNRATLQAKARELEGSVGCAPLCWLPLIIVSPGSYSHPLTHQVRDLVGEKQQVASEAARLEAMVKDTSALDMATVERDHLKAQVAKMCEENTVVRERCARSPPPPPPPAGSTTTYNVPRKPRHSWARWYRSMNS